MAETSSSTSNNGSVPILKLAPDHLFTILLLLPIDSILSFSMSCKRFRSLACSDSLWESICRRDWEQKSVDALKSVYHHHERQLLPWMSLYEKVYKLDSVYCHKLSDPDGEFMVPSPRASHSLNFVSDCLVLFGGGCEGGQFFFSPFIDLINLCLALLFLLVCFLIHCFFQDQYFIYWFQGN